MASRKKAETSPVADFEKSLKGLESIVEKLERGEHSLQDSLRFFEEGIALSRRCQEALVAAEQRVRILVEDDRQGQSALQAFDDPADGDKA